MISINTSKLSFRLLFIALVFALLLPMAFHAAPAFAKSTDIIEFGIVQSMPANGLMGNWVIGGSTYLAISATTFDSTSGLLVVGACVKIRTRAVYYSWGRYVDAISGASSSKCR